MPLHVDWGSNTQTIASIEAEGLVSTELVELPPYHYAVIMERP
jgi:hypothetical protein